MLFSKDKAPAIPKYEADLDLVSRVLSKDRRAFDEFFHEYFQRIYRFCLKRLDDKALSEDLTQETLVKAIRSLDQYRGEAALFTWLCQICRHQISDWHRRPGVAMAGQKPIDDDEQVQAALDSLQLQQDAERQTSDERDELVHLTLDSLPARYGDVLELKYIQGFSVEEISGRLNLTATSVQSLLARARTAFRRNYADLLREVGRELGQPVGKQSFARSETS